MPEIPDCRQRRPQDRSPCPWRRARARLHRRLRRGRAAPTGDPLLPARPRRDRRHRHRRSGAHPRRGRHLDLQERPAGLPHHRRAGLSRAVALRLPPVRQRGALSSATGWRWSRPKPRTIARQALQAIRSVPAAAGLCRPGAGRRRARRSCTTTASTRPYPCPTGPRSTWPPSRDRARRRRAGLRRGATSSKSTPTGRNRLALRHRAARRAGLFRRDGAGWWSSPRPRCRSTPGGSSPRAGHPRGMVRVIKPRIGGGFGGKQEVFLEPLAALVAWRTKRPARLVLSRKEVFVSAPHPPRHEAPAQDRRPERRRRSPRWRWTR